MVFLKEFFEKVDFGKKSANDKKHEKFCGREGRDISLGLIQSMEVDKAFV